MNLLMGIDVGTSGAKTVLIDEKGRIAASDTQEYPLHTPRHGWAEQDPADWWDGVRKSIRAALRKAGAGKNQVKAVGLTGQMHGAVCLDKNNNVVCPAILWCDQRTAVECAEITEKVGKEKIFDITCNPVLTGFQAPKIIWLRKNKPKTYERVRKVLLPKDYIRFRLTGTFATDVSDASGTSLFDVRKRTWSAEILRSLDIPADFVPPAYESTAVTGAVSRIAAQATGLDEGIPVVAGGGDQAAGGVGNGIVAEGLVSVTTGTSGVVFAHADKITVDPRGRLHTFCHAVPGKWHLMGVVLSAGGSFRWYRDTFCGEEAAAAKKMGKDPYEIITARAEKTPAGAAGLLFLPYLTGERCPYPDPAARGVFFGISLMHTRPYFARAVMEGVTFALRDCIEIMKEIGLPPGEKFRISGGGAKSKFWSRMQADVFNKKTVKLSSEEGPSFGAAIIAGAGIKMFRDIPSACRTILKETASFTPAQKNVILYDRLYKVYGELYRQLKDSFPKLNA